jgi:hypothetical protein
MKEDAIERLFKDIKKFKVSLPDDFSFKQLMDGNGEAVCYIVNDLTNKELIRRKFQFLRPKVEDYEVADKKLVESEEEAEEEKHLGDDESIILGSRMLSEKDL